jgi:hypothetical protein
VGLQHHRIVALILAQQRVIGTAKRANVVPVARYEGVVWRKPHGNRAAESAWLNMLTVRGAHSRLLQLSLDVEIKTAVVQAFRLLELQSR